MMSLWAVQQAHMSSLQKATPRAKPLQSFLDSTFTTFTNITGGRSWQFVGHVKDNSALALPVLLALQSITSKNLGNFPRRCELDVAVIKHFIFLLNRVPSPRLRVKETF